MSGKTVLTKMLAQQSPEVVLLNESYTLPNRYLPLMTEYIVKNGICYNQFAYGTQLLFMQNRIRREWLCKDPSKTYLIDRSIYEDRHIFAKLFADLGLLDQGEYNEYKDMFEKIVRNLDAPDCFVMLNTDPDLCYDRLRKLNHPLDVWLTREILHKMDQLYRTRLKERVVLYNPKIKLIEIDTTKHDSLESLVKATAIELNKVYKNKFQTEVDSLGQVPLNSEKFH